MQNRDISTLSSFGEPQASLAQEAGRWALSMLTSAADAIVGFDLSYTITFWNAGCERLFGWRAEEILGQSLCMLLPEGRHREMARVVEALSEAQDQAAVETERLHRSGAVVPVSVHLSPVRDAITGDALGACAVVRDNARELDLRGQLETALHLAEARFKQSVIARATLSTHGAFLEVNAAMLHLVGVEDTDLLGRSITELLVPTDASDAAAQWARLVGGTNSGQREPRLLRHADGHLVETDVSVVAVRDRSGQIAQLEVEFDDVSDAAAARRELELGEARWRLLTSRSSTVSLLCDADAQLVFATDPALSVFGYRAQDLVDGDGWSFIHPDDVDNGKAAWAATVAAPQGTSATLELRILHADGTWRWTEETITNQLDDRAVRAMVVNLTDITPRKSAEAVLEQHAGIDTLTGLPTRAPLMAALDAAFAAGRAASTAVAVIDITRLKLVNDRYGHLMGDQAMIEVATRLAGAVPEHAVVARIGGDRFGLLLTEVHEASRMLDLTSALLQVIEAPLQLDENRFVITATVGAAIGPALDSGALLASAEAALTVGKQGLTGPIHVVQADSASAAMSRARLIEDLDRGLKHQELVVHFQPVIDVAGGRLLGAEALVRWAHPDKGLLSPGAFIDAAEDSGLVVDVGRVVLEEACRAAARWSHLGGRDGFYLAVNLSAKQLNSGDIVRVVQQALADSGARPQDLMLEVTESAVMSDMHAAVRTLQELRQLGVSIAVDDFGTGYASLTYLKQFPVTALKIDRSFVSGLGSNSDDAAIVTSVIDLARAMGLECIAEGVETEQQRLILHALGCESGQGFLWSPALDPVAFQAWAATAEAALSSSRSNRRVSGPTAGSAPERPLDRPAVQAAVLSRVVELSAQGASLNSIAAALNAGQHLTAAGKKWTSRSVAQVLPLAPLGVSAGTHGLSAASSGAFQRLVELAADADVPFEHLVRPLLSELQHATGLAMTYLTRVDQRADTQEIAFAQALTADPVQEGLVVPWSESVCKRALESGPRRTDDAPAAYTGTDFARRLSVASYIVEPVNGPRGDLYGTLCGASTDARELTESDSATVRMYARLIEQKLAAGIGATEERTREGLLSGVPGAPADRQGR